jgi:SAM-dependent methyltransferase
MSEERRVASLPKSADPGELPDGVPPPPAAIGGGPEEARTSGEAIPEAREPATTPVDDEGASALVRRRARTLRIPDDDVSRPLGGPDAPLGGARRVSEWPSSNRSLDREPSSAAVVTTRIITINPPAPAEVDPIVLPEDAPTPRPDVHAVPEEGWSQPSLPEIDGAERDSGADDTLESIRDADPSTPRTRATPIPFRVPGMDADGEDVRFDDDVPTPAIPRVERVSDAGERRSDPGDAPEIALEDVVAVEAAPTVASPPPAPPPAKKPAVPPRPPLVIVPPHVGNVAPQSAEPIGSRRKGRLWWEDFFNDDYLRTVEKTTDEQIAREVDFIEGSLSVERGGALLDLACGTGRHAIELGARGYGVVGFDLSLAMLARAGEDAQERGVRLNLVQGDMRDMTFDEQFDGVFCWNTSFGYFEEEKNAQVVDRVHRSLKAGGLFLLDVINRDFAVRQSPSLAWFEGDGCVCMDEMIVDFITSRMRVKRTMMLDDGRTREVEYSLRTYSLHELGKILHDHGFKVCEVSGRLATPGVFFGNESPRTIILAEKR